MLVYYISFDSGIIFTFAYIKQVCWIIRLTFPTNNIDYSIILTFNKNLL